jgi:hypothetical protein
MAETKAKRVLTPPEEINRKYVAARGRFVDRVQRDIREASSESTALDVMYREGRRFDKIGLVWGVKGRTRGERKIIFHVHQKTGHIFGARTADLPNYTRWFGTVYEFERWKWGTRTLSTNDIIPIPVDPDDPEYIIARKYGNVNHYRSTDEQVNALIDNIQKGLDQL